MQNFKPSLTLDDLADLRSWREAEAQKWMDLERDVDTYARYAIALADATLQRNESQKSDAAKALDEQRARCLQSQAVWAEICARIARAADEIHPH